MHKRKEDYEIRMIDALLRYHFHIEPDALDDELWAMRWNELKEVLL